ncbi:GerMN domain-containing protein [Phycicoccus sp. CSK15P-2]|uniref:GerMN domain-containing protein n=1 Tax=Phycicoccus sp. CSK15P-2 TaxID=2807627 RepID=UPI001950BE19|nr:GerMN domain-containing protein [Phycicoccus sp. CSK15P-2]MBM6405989.1 GerMN domain-containing protein [Phycicoccus sp. CSK15P-2]
MSALGRAVAVVGVLVLTGCGALSRSGPVQTGLEVGSGGTSPVTIVFPGPARDASQEAIVRGFLRAGAASDGAYDNARRFLTPTVSEQWNPDGTIVLLASDAAPTVRQVGGATVEVSAEAAGTVDETGRYTAAEPGSRVTARFVLATVDGQNRISAIPEGFGRWIVSRDVARLVQPYSVHYVSSSRRALVPDVRWFPLDRLATRLALAQLQPVPQHLEGAAVSAVPAGARLLGDAVSVENGVATVDLISSAIDVGQTTRQNLWAQFIRTLTQDSSVIAVRVAVDGVPVELDGIQGSVSSVTRVGFPSPTPPTSSVPPVVRRGEQLSFFGPDDRGGPQATPTPEATELPVVPAGFTSLALAADGGEVAAVDPGGDGISRWRAGTRYEVPRFATSVSAPSYDRRGYLWAGGVSGAQRLFVVDTRSDPSDPEAAAATPVTAEWLKGRQVLQVKVAADGDRVVVLSAAPGGRNPRVDLAGVVRGEDDRPQRLAAPLALGVGFTGARGLVWVDDETVATIAATPGRGALPTLLSTGGDVQTLEEVPGADAVATTGDERNLYVITAKGDLYVRVGQRWAENGEAGELAAPGG